VPHNVSQRKPSNRSIFQFKYLREFVDSAESLSMPDDTTVHCRTTWTGAVALLETDVDDASALLSENVTESAEPALVRTQSEPAAPKGEPTDKRTIVTQDSTGPRVSWRRWGRDHSARRLLLRDLRALIDRVDELGLPTEDYVVRAMQVSRSFKLHVHSVSAEPLGA
jgi:hypothetical protein